jgi:selT/selW/selH-like putative selenoprotein
LAEAIKASFGFDADLKPSQGGCFEVVADGELVFSKLKEGRFPDHREVVSSLMHKQPKSGG